jgi:thiamine-monophosphate kinase
MLIKDIGGEVNLIEKLAGIVTQNHDEVIMGIGDDAAVLKIAGDRQHYMLVTTDTLVGNDHFNISWSSAQEIGNKSVECNVSDIAAMGGFPTFMFISLVLMPDTTVEWSEALYHGIADSCKKYNIVILGGDTTHGPVETINITLFGKVAKENLCLRSHAKAGDILAVTGPLGGSTAGLYYLRNKIPLPPYLREKHITPKCRLHTAQKIAPFVHAMIDISDGLASEVKHICKQSKTGAIIHADKIPLHDEVIKAGQKLNVDPVEFALNGGEDFELLFSINENDLEKLNQTGESYYIIGKITSQDQGCFIQTEKGKKVPLKGGYDHFG